MIFLPTLASGAATVIAQPPTIVVDRDNVEIRESCIVEIGAEVIADADNNGVLHIVADDITVEFSSDESKRELMGAAKGTDLDQLTGIGIRIDGRKNITLRNAHCHYFKVGVHATGADGLVLKGCDVSDGYSMRLKSTPQAEDGSDWLWPHRNESNEWMTNYGAGIYIENSNDVIVRNTFARRRQNGIVLDAVTQGQIYDNDCSFLSGWGLAMWKSSMNIVTRNAFDFCVRGYSHGVYNRGQDSAGILMFEQNCDNVIAENSVTHGGDGIFGFAGVEAIGDLWLEQERARLRAETGEQEVDHLIVYPAELLRELYRRGNNRNVIINNDLSYAPAHGLEMTFSFDNQIIGNRFVENAICGIWGGYSQDTLIAGNDFVGNGEMAYGLERGGVNIEHGVGNVIVENTFERNKAGVHLWWDNDEGLMRSPWGIANTGTKVIAGDSTGGVPRNGAVEGRLAPSKDNVIAENTFMGDDIAIHLRDSHGTYAVRNTFHGDKEKLRVESSQVIDDEQFVQTWHETRYPVLGESKPLGARSELAGRDKIIMTEWGPYDWHEPRLHLISKEVGRHVYRLLGNDAFSSLTIEGTGQGAHVRAEEAGNSWQFVVTPRPGQIDAPKQAASSITTYQLEVTTRGGSKVVVQDRFIDSCWKVVPFNWTTDPRADLDAWHREAEERGVTFEIDSLDLRFGGGGPSSLADVPEDVKQAGIGGDHFGIIATTQLAFPPGSWRIRTSSDDGIRVWVNDNLVIDDWTWHVPTRHDAILAFDQPTNATIRVEYFELTGHAELTVEIEPVE
jgi:nitrous oxidase accessory protein NosD